MEKWLVAAKKADFEGWAKRFSVSPVTARIIRNRGLTEEEEVQKFLYGTLADCYSPRLMKDMDKAAAAIAEAVEEEEHIRVIGDYDVDGICSSYILSKGLSLLGAHADTAIPHRIHDGYGLSDGLIEEAKAEGVRMIVTCDNGIAASSQIQLANSYGIKVVVTDHHEVPFENTEGGRQELIPPAIAVIDPKQERCGYPFSGICGTVVAYKLMQVMAEETGNKDLQEAMDEFLEFAALATVCDVMELKDENRIIVKEGLTRIRNTKNMGLRALMEVSQIEPAKVNAYHLGFVIGPCLNATGRLDTAVRALELLRSGTKQEAMSIAGELRGLNESRKSMTLKGVEQAVRIIEEEHMEQDKVMVIYLPEIHESIAGIIAGRVREKYNHPVFLLTKGEEGVKGSGRSVEGYHMYEAMNAVAHLFTKFGGHAMAAGLSMEEENIDVLRRELNEKCTLQPEDFVATVHIDVPMPLSFGTPELAEEIERLEPFGVGNPKPLFAQKNLTFLSGVKMGANHNFARYTVEVPEGGRLQLVYFGDLEKFGRFLEEKYGPGSEDALYRGGASFQVSVVYQLGRNTYRGKTEVQYVMQYFC